VELVTTDGFLFPNKELEARGLMRRKGFPESYDIRHLVEFVANIRAGHEKVEAPVYSHLIYDILPDEKKVVEQPDILILEGSMCCRAAWIIPRTLIACSCRISSTSPSMWMPTPSCCAPGTSIASKFRSGAFSDPDSYFHHYAKLAESEATEIANNIWQDINYLNLQENILPTRERANLILTKGNEHAIEQIKLRK
jgi:type I pantothenate kinase